MPHSSNSRPRSRSIHGNAFSWPIATSTSSHGKCTSGSPVGDELAAALRVALRRDLLERDAGELAVVVREGLRHEEVVDRDALVPRVFLLPRRRLHLVEAGAHDDLHVLAAEAPRAAAAVHRGVAAAEHDRRACRSSWCGRTTRSTASRCRCGCSPRLRRGRARRGRARAARRCRRRSRRSPAPSSAFMLSMRCPARKSTPRSST